MTFFRSSLSILFSIRIYWICSGVSDAAAASVAALHFLMCVYTAVRDLNSLLHFAQDGIFGGRASSSLTSFFGGCACVAFASGGDG